MTNLNNFDFLDSVAKDTNTKLDPTDPSLVLPNKFRFDPAVAPTLNFRIFDAIGGQIVQIDRFNVDKYTIESVLYVIPNDQDLGMALGKIITLHYLSK